MGEFVITTPGGEEFTIEAADESAALKIMNDYQSKNFTGKTDANGVPEGMVFDPATNRMVDAKALADQAIPGGSWAGSAIKGLPFLGEYADEAVGWILGKDDPVNHPNESAAIETQVAREAAKTFDNENPNIALASKIGVGLSTIPAAMMATPAALTSGSLLARSALGAGTGAALGGAEGFVSGYGEGEGDNRMDSAIDRAKWSAATGAVLGGAMPVVAGATQAGVQKLKDAFTVDRQVKALGLKRPAADTLAATLKADDTLGPTGLKRLQAAGDDAMLADAGDTAAGLLDTTIQKSNTGGRIAQAAVQKRAETASKRLKGTMDMLLGKPEGVDKAARDIAKKTQAARQAAYNAAYSKPIDYASDAGRDIEDVFARTPPGILNAAISEANDAMRVNGARNMQIMADIADDGSVTFRQMPNMQQVDELKKALNVVAETQVDQFGRKTAAGVRAAQLARELRDAAKEAVDEYKTALKLGGDKIAEDNALKLGNVLLRPATTREEVREAVKGMTDAERKQLALGLRQQIDDAMANVTQALSDGNVDAREAAKALKDMSSRSAREKLVVALGEKRAVPLFKELDRAQAAINLKAATVTNSKTFARTEAAKAIEGRNSDGVWNKVKEGRPLEAPRTMWQKLTGADAESRMAGEEEIYADIARVLTGPRGQDAQLALQRLEAAYRTGNLNQETAHRIGQILAGTAASSGYQFSTQGIRK